MNRTSSNPRRLDALDELGGRRRVDRERHERLAALRRPRDGHVRDVDARLAEHRPDLADHAGHVVVREERHVRRELDVDREPERAGEEEAVLGTDGRPGDLDVLAARADDDADEVRVVLRRGEALLRDLDPALGRDERRVDLVHGLVDPTLERAVQRGDRQESRVVLRERAVDGDRRRAPATRRRAPSRGGRASPRAGRTGRATSSSRGSTTGMLTAVRTTSPSSAAATCSAITTPARSCASVVDPARCGVTTTCGSPRSGPEYGSVSNTSSAAPATLPERIASTSAVLVDEPAARGVDDPHAVLHPRERRRIEEPARLVVQREVQRDRRRPRRTPRRATRPTRRRARGSDRPRRTGRRRRRASRARARDVRPGGRSVPSPSTPSVFPASSTPVKRCAIPGARPSARRAPAARCGRARRGARSHARRRSRRSTRRRSRRRSRGGSRRRRRRCRRPRLPARSPSAGRRAR